MKLFALPRRRSSISASTSGSPTPTARAGCKALHRAGALVDRRLRALPRAARAGAGTRVAGLGRAAPRSRAGARCAQAREELADRDPVSLLPAVARRRPVARRRARPATIGVFGDFPFMVSGDSADVWSRQQDFRLDASVGAPPDAFSETGQDWGFPAYRWDAIAAGGYELARGARAAQRRALRRLPRRSSRRVLPHLRARSGRRGRRSCRRTKPIRSSRGSGARRPQRAPARGSSPRISASFPTSCATTLTGLEIPGYKVLRWEREWDEPGKPFKDPLSYPACSVATSGTHDTETDGGVVGRGADRGARRRWPRVDHDGPPGSGSRGAVQRRRRATPSCSSSTAPAPTSSCCRSRTCSGGRSGSTRRR